MRSRGHIVQQKTNRPVQFEISQQTRVALEHWIAEGHLQQQDYLFKTRVGNCLHLSTRQYYCIVQKCVTLIGLDPLRYGTHSLRRTKAPLIYRRARNLQAVRLLLGHTKQESTLRYLSIEVDDALELAEPTET